MTQPTPLSSDDNSLAKPAEAGHAGPAGPAFVVPPQPGEDLFAARWKWMMEVADEIERIDPDLPADLAENHEYYRLGRRRSDD